MADAYFTTGDGRRFLPTDHCRGPWDADACHAGPPTGLMARALEGLLPDHPLVRLTVDLLRPIPMAGFVVTASVTRAGRRVAHAEAALEAPDGTVVATARGLHLAGTPIGVPATGDHRPDLAAAVPGPFPIHTTVHGLPGFADSVEVRYDPSGSVGMGGRSTMWLRPLVPLLADEAPSPFQRICPLADCGNGISYLAYLDEVGFVNPDLTLWLHRPPEGEWHAAEAVSFWQESGIGASEVRLFDTAGPVGGAVQTLLLLPPA